MSDTGTSLTLLHRLKSDEADAWYRLVVLYGPLVRYWAGRSGVPAADADDVAQDVFREVAGGLAAFRRDRPGDSFRGWLRGVTRFVVLRHQRKEGRQPRAGGGTDALLHLNAVPDAAADDPAADEPDPPAERNALYRRALELVRGEFEPKSWQMFWATTVDGRPAADVATEMGVSSAAVRQAKSRVLRRLKEEVGDMLD